MVTVYLGNRDAVEVLREADGTEHHITLPPAEPFATVTPPPGTPWPGILAAVTGPDREQTPAWVAVEADDQVYGDALAMLLGAHYGCEVRDPAW